MEPLEIINSTYETGAFWASDEGRNVRPEDLGTLTLEDRVVKEALRARSIAQVTDYAPAVLEAHGREPDFDGQVGPAMESMLATPRCHVPDYAPPKDVKFVFPDPDLQEVVERMQADGTAEAFGDGNWRGCWDVGQFHAASVRVHKRGIGSHLDPVFRDVLGRVHQAYAGVGLLFHFIDSESMQDILTGEKWDDRINIEFIFVQRSSGWIGLAIVGQNQTCSSNIWCKYKAGYRGSSVAREWTTLIKHELGHNCGMGHFPGRNNVMNPSLIEGLPTEWSDRDSSTAWLRRRFGGEPVPIDGPPGPGPDPPPTGTEGRLKALERALTEADRRLDAQAVQDAIHSSSIQYLLRKVG